MEPGVLLKEVRRRAGLTQTELARRAGTSQPVISAYEHGRRDPSYATLRRFIEAAGERLRLEAVATRAGDIAPPADLHEHAQRLIDVLSLADAIPRRPPRAILHAPRLISR
ncbi:MAG: helix-turn-helix domain-containing protein [Acidimicrobiales bacterium]